MSTRKRFYRVTNEAFLFFSVIPSAVYIIYNDRPTVLVINVLIIIGIFIIDKLDSGRDIQRKIFRLKKVNIAFFVLFISILMIPYIIRIDNINLANIFLEDIYESRSSYESNVYLSYTSSPLSKVLLPFLLISFIELKKHFLAILGLLFIILIYLTTGAQKDVLIGMTLVLFCYFIIKKYGISKLMSSITLATTAASILGVILYYFNHLAFFVTYIRRALFVGPGLSSVYLDYFTSNPYTNYSHSNIGQLFNDGDRLNLTRWAGHNLLGRDVNANIGIFLEGYVSFGIIGLLISLMMMLILVGFLKKLNISYVYMGIWISFMYVINFSLLETLLITHGLVIFVLVAYFLVPRENKTRCKYENRNSYVSGVK